MAMRRRGAVAGLVLAGLLACAGAGPVEGRAGTPRGDLDGLRELAREQGSVGVIARLEVPGVEALTAESARHRVVRPGHKGAWAGTAADEALARAIEAVAREVVTSLDGTAVAVTRTYRSLPMLALRASGPALAALAALPQVASLQEDRPVELDGAAAGGGPASGPGPGMQPPTGVRLLQDTVGLVGARNAWAAGVTGSGWHVAILDTGIRSSHELFAGKSIEEACFALGEDGAGPEGDCPNGLSTMNGPGAAASHPSALDSGHGTHVAGIAAGHGPTLSGVAPGAGIVAVQVFSRFPERCGCVLSWRSDQLAGLDHVYSLRGTLAIAAVNLSLGAGRASAPCDDDLLAPAVENLRAAGIATVISAGNEAACGSVSVPACVPGGVSVGATTKADQPWYSTNWHPTLVHLFAPGASVRSATASSDTSYAFFSGTSMAAPHVAGAWALLQQAAPGSVGETLTALRASGSGITSPCDGHQTPVPRIQVDAAIGFLQGLLLRKSGTLDPAVVGDPAITEVGDEIRYAIAVTSSAGAALANVLLSDPLVTVACPSGNPIPALAAGATETCTATHLVTRADIDARQVVNTATASALAPGGSEVHVSASCTVSIPVEADLQLELSLDPSAARPGDAVRVHLSVRNLGPYPARETEVTVFLQRGLTVVSDICGSGPPPNPGVYPTFHWEVGDVARGATAACTVTATVDAGVSPGGLWVEASARSAADDPTPWDSWVATSLTVLARPIPALGGAGLAALALLLAAVALAALRRP